MSPVKRVQTVRAACEVMETIADLHLAGVTEISERAGQDISSTQRLLETLHEAGWIHPTSSKQTQWQLSSKLLQLARQVPAISLVEGASAILERLRDDTKESVWLTALEGTGFVVIEAAESKEVVRMTTPIGDRFPLRGSASGGAVMAHLPPEVAQRLSGFTASEVEAESAMARDKGYVLKGQEAHQGVITVAAAVLDNQRYPIGAVLIGAPSSRVDEATSERLGSAAVRGAKTFSQRMRTL
jgi:IclR family acetate operon transcriptional repressor